MNIFLIYAMVRVSRIIPFFGVLNGEKNIPSPFDKEGMLEYKYVLLY
ncbi:MAG: hypothetical protein KDE33_16755 [Bacteroidetes bacterium]|nr:hypothetical protein [Bacteroidota bacterium]